MQGFRVRTPIWHTMPISRIYPPPKKRYHLMRKGLLWGWCVVGGPLRSPSDSAFVAWPHNDHFGHVHPPSTFSGDRDEVFKKLVRTRSTTTRDRHLQRVDFCLLSLSLSPCFLLCDSGNCSTVCILHCKDKWIYKGCL